ncbi:MAG: sodium:solute symporter family protein [Synergistaceae bacterium]|nr:sodium:solute symporter family protein [Synergistaceae bacterium]
MTESLLIPQLIGFGTYALVLILLAGEAFSWDGNRQLYYLGDRALGLWSSIATFCATWMSGASVLGYTMLLYREGYRAFTGSVNGWLLGLLPLIFIVPRLRKSRVLSMPQWLAETYKDRRLRRLSALVLLLAYTLYLVIQFRVFGTVVAHLLEIRYVVASLMIYLFVIYTTFGGLPAVVRSDVLNLVVIVAGVTLAAVAVGISAGGPIALHQDLARTDPAALSTVAPHGTLATLAMMGGWALGVASNPQYAVRILSARTPRTAWLMLGLAPLILGWIYLCLTVIGLGGRHLLPFLPPMGQEMAFAQLTRSLLGPLPTVLLFLAVLAAAVSTANSQLLLAACAFCYDLKEKGRQQEAALREDHFLLGNSLAVAAIATVALGLSLLPLPTILDLGQHSWAAISLCFLLPLYCPRRWRRKGLLGALSIGFLCHGFLVFLMGLRPETALIPALIVESVWWRLRGARP